MAMSVSNSKFKVVWGALESSGQTLWTRIGLAWVGKDGALFARLNAFPLTGRIRVGGEDREASGLALIEEVGQ
jgi:hypothetical protein